MTFPTRAMSRALAVSALTLAAVMFSAAPAGADVNVTADYPVRDGYATLDFHASSDSETNALLTQFIVALPNQTWVSTEQMPGWTVRLDPDLGPGRSVTWTAAPGGGTPPNQFASFRIMMKLPNTDEVSLPATQVYSDGTVVRWDQKPLPSGIKPDHPAPMLTLTAPEDTQQNTHSASQPAPPDATARWLAVGALAVALLAAALALSARRRS